MYVKWQNGERRTITGSKIVTKIQKFEDLEVWKEGIFGIDVGKFAVAILILLVAIFIRKFFAQLVIGRVKKFVKTTKTRFDVALMFLKAANTRSPLGSGSTCVFLRTQSPCTRIKGIIKTVTIFNAKTLK